MRDAKLITEVKFEMEGEPAEVTGTWITEYGDIYITLYNNGRWCNIMAKDLKKYIKPKFSETCLVENQSLESKFY